jgi:HPt (histidine-containing phosphotransfer) domain-containing protein
MSEQDKLQQQLGDIGLRYLKRTLGEIGTLRDLLQNLQNGQPGALKEIEHLSHKIHGSGAMFGFDELSRHARAIELGAADKADGALALHEKLRRHIEDLAAAVDAAAIERNLQK